MSDDTQQRAAFERTAQALGVSAEVLARDLQGNYITQQARGGWQTWQKSRVTRALPPAPARTERILAVYHEQGSCRENDESDHISFANAVLDEFTAEPSSNDRQSSG